MSSSPNPFTNTTTLASLAHSPSAIGRSSRSWSAAMATVGPRSTSPTSIRPRRSCLTLRMGTDKVRIQLE